MTAWRRAEAQAWEKVEDRRWLGFWREDLDRHHKGERAALGKAHADSERQIEREVREVYRRGLRDAEQREPPTDVERAAREMKERGRGTTRIPPPRPPEPRGPERGGGGFER